MHSYRLVKLRARLKLKEKKELPSAEEAWGPHMQPGPGGGGSWTGYRSVVGRRMVYSSGSCWV